MFAWSRIWIPFIALCFVQNIAHAQTESIQHFEDEMENIIADARDSGIKSLTFRIHAYQSEGQHGEKRKVRIKCVNDSIVVRKVRLKRDYFVARNGNLLPYDPKTNTAKKYTPLYVKDSANCQVIWGEAEGMKDSAHTSYCRFTYDSSGREVDYYYVFRQICYHRITTYEGDSISIVDFWSRDSDTMRLMYNRYIYQSYNADSSFYIRVVKERMLPNEVKIVDGEVWQEYRTFITYDARGRVAAIREEEGFRYSRSATYFDTVNTLNVTYH